MKYNTTQFTVKKIEGKTGIQVELIRTFDFGGKENEAVAAMHHFKDEEITDDIKNALMMSIDKVVKEFTK